jgi:guanine deaminase
MNRITDIGDPTAHAEVMAIREACRVLNTFQLDGCTLYTSCEPCPMCLGAVYWSRIESVNYAANRQDAADIHFDDDFIYKEAPLLPEERTKSFIISWIIHWNPLNYRNKNWIKSSIRMSLFANALTKSIKTCNLNVNVNVNLISIKKVHPSSING